MCPAHRRVASLMISAGIASGARYRCRLAMRRPAATETEYGRRIKASRRPTPMPGAANSSLPTDRLDCEIFVTTIIIGDVV